MEKRYYWLKLKRDFFKDPKIMLINRMKKGKEILLFYIFLLTESIERNGKVAFDDGRGYSEKELAQLSGFTLSTVRLALETLSSCGFLRFEENGVLVLDGLSDMVGSEGKSAERMRRKRNEASHCDASVTQRKSIEKEIEIESDQELEERNTGEVFVQSGQDMTDYYVSLSFDQQRDLIDRMGAVKLADYLTKMDQFVALKQRRFKDPYGTILKWYEEDRKA